ncbi:peroxisome biogenesis protein 22 isoform X2 [Amborella trichopoda]|uniref:Peroxisome biogenesis protein 22 n=1 Tax=Amborella trichopoda TaxID=13333 RepID=W1PNY5_AMBTC|nr:peroxisome biogenesis protein 22 isoform X2 [Amborella trichopoda]ERN09524.1 hypothetical protein AMTR_s00029p00135950 [Amborella trichopoda]|eukprot:XP_006847943.1 peroxisome biogenesis protein 22 isoform X2 [Amborella trichopoda]
MADSLTAELVLLLKRVSTHLTVKISNLLMLLSNHKNAGSIGALAGFAIAIVFTWKFLRSPGGQQRRQPKRRGAASSSSDGTQLTPSEVASPYPLSPVNDSKGQDVVEELPAPVKLTLGQIVRKKLNGGRKMTCQLLGVIFEEKSPEELQEHATVRPLAAEVLMEISKSCDLYLMERIIDDKSGEIALSALEAAGLFTSGGLIKDKVLFCSTENGRSSFVRQLEPDWHVDTNIEIISQLARFIRYQLHISPAGPPHIASNVFGSTSLEHYFSLLDQC